MRDVLFIYRVLLPPLALLILGCLQPSEEHAQVDVDVHPADNLDSPLIGSGSVLNSRQAHLKLKGSIGFNRKAVSAMAKNMKEIFTRGQKDKEFITARWRHGITKTSTEVNSKHEINVFRQYFQLLKNYRKNTTVALVEFNDASPPVSGSVPDQSKSTVRPFGHRHRLPRSLEDKPPKRAKLRTPQTVPPEYMIQLYRLLEGTHYNLLMNTVVTSFININEQDLDNVASSSKSEDHAPTLPLTSTTLVFNVSLPKEEEIIQYAEVRLYLARACDPPELDTCKTLGQINIHELDIESENSASSLIACKNFSVANGTWESVNVTSAVLSWATSGLKAFKVNISYETSETNTNIAIENLDGKDPLLVVFSKKSGHVDRTQHKLEKRDTSSSVESLESSLLQQITTNQNNYSRHYFQGLLNAVTTMERDAHYLPASVDAPLIPSIDKEKAGNSNNSVLNNTFQNQSSGNILHSESPLKHETLQNMPPASESENEMSDSRSYVQKTHEIVNSKTNSEKMDDEFYWDPVLVSRVRRHAKARFRRHLDVLFNDRHVEVAHSRFKRSKKKRNSCRRHELYIEFKDIKWDKSIIFPDGYQAFECIGKCYFPIGAHLSPTKHAIIQTLLHTSYPDRASRACCVPTKLEPISILYYDNSSNNSIRYDYTYDGMIAAECGCR